MWYRYEVVLATTSTSAAARSAHEDDPPLLLLANDGRCTTAAAVRRAARFCKEEARSKLLQWLRKEKYIGRLKNPTIGKYGNISL